MVELLPSKQVVAGSSPVSRSKPTLSEFSVLPRTTMFYVLTFAFKLEKPLRKRIN